MIEPIINVNISSEDDYIEMEWDVVNCDSLQQEAGKWLKLRLGKFVPT
ncbi:Ycf34 family protein [cyanobacterium endosymbiont of Rhopalodia gibberula]